MRKIAAFLLVSALLFCCASLSLADDDSAKIKESPKEACGCPPSLGRAPDFTLADLDGKEVKLSDFRGKGVILFFWATWCSICREHIPELNKAHEALAKEDIELLAVNIGESEKKVRRFLKNEEINFHILLDKSQDVSRSFVVIGPPTYIVIDKLGYIKFQNHFWPYNYKEYICE